MTGRAKDRILARLKTIEGHIRGVRRMVDQDTDCLKILDQTLVVQRALIRLTREILENHLRPCVTAAMEEADEQDRTRLIEGLLAVLEASARL